MPTMHKRCIYVSPETGVECEIWFSDENTDLCILHRGAVNVSLASNGTNKDPYIAKRNDAMLSVIDMIRGLSSAEALQVCDQHQARIEQAIEDLKIQALAWRGKKGELLDGLSDEERKARQKIRTPKIQSADSKAKRPSAAHEVGREMLAKEKAIASLMKTGKSREQAERIWEMS